MLPDWLINSCPSGVSKATKCQSCASVVLMRKNMESKEGFSEDFMVVGTQQMALDCESEREKENRSKVGRRCKIFVRKRMVF